MSLIRLLGGIRLVTKKPRLTANPVGLKQLASPIPSFRWVEEIPLIYAAFVHPPVHKTTAVISAFKCCCVPWLQSKPMYNHSCTETDVLRVDTATEQPQNSNFTFDDHFLSGGLWNWTGTRIFPAVTSIVNPKG